MKHNKLRKTDYLVYKNIPCCNMSEKEIIDTSNLFSEHYGVWSSYCPDSSKCNESLSLMKHKQILVCDEQKVIFHAVCFPITCCPAIMLFLYDDFL